jgi:predicted phage-related endonuclease
LLGQAVPSKYLLQMQWQMACTGRLWGDFVSFDPRMPEDMRLFVKRVERDEGRIEEIAEAVILFLSEVADKVAQLEALYRSPQLEAAE